MMAPSKALHGWVAAVVAVACTQMPGSVGKIHDTSYDCQLRQLARDYTQEIILGSSHWEQGRATKAVELLEKGLLLTECPLVHMDVPAPAPAVTPTPPQQQQSGGTTKLLYVDGKTGYDSNTGTSRSTALKTVAGAQALIKKMYPTVSARPAVTVLIAQGDYHFGKAGPDHLKHSVRYSRTNIALFDEADSGASPDAPITYTSDPTNTHPPRFVGGVLLDGLAWSPAAPSSGLPKGVVMATVPGAVAFDLQDQIFIRDNNGTLHPIVRARTPNGMPWIPNDGYNLTVVGGWNYTANNCGNDGNVHGPDCGEVLKSPPVMTECEPTAPPPPPPPPGHPPMPSSNNCVDVTVVCGATGAVQILGKVGTGTASSRGLVGGNGTVRVANCLEHLLDVGFDWPKWNAANYGGPSLGGCGVNDDYNETSPCVNKLDTTYNHPLWFGPWVSSIQVNVTQDAGTGVDLSKYTWTAPENIVVHAHADGDWGGVQFRVADAPHGKFERVRNRNPNVESKQNHRQILNFSIGGFQQARGARLGPGWGSYPGHPDGRAGEVYYMEGSIEFLDREGEWFFDPKTRQLYVFPPAALLPSASASSAGNSSGTMMDAGASLLLTQTDTLFEIVGSSSDKGKRVENIVFSKLSFGYTSAQFFRPHEETSGGDYSTHRSGAVKIENATNVQVLSNDFSWIGGNAVFLSNSVKNCTVQANMFQFLGTSGVAVQGKTGNALMDGRDGEAMMAAHGPSADNGVRLPTNNLVSNNMFADYGIWDKQSACYHKALAPNNMFLNNVCFNSSRHGVNFQDGFGGGGIAEGNVMFNLNRETSDTTAFNSWNRRNYITSDPKDPAVGVIVPPTLNEWRRNLILGRDYYGILDGNGNGLRNDDGASFYNHSSNILYLASIEFNGGTEIHSHGNVYLQTSWVIGRTPDVASSFNDTFVDTPQRFFGGGCLGFWNTTRSHSGPHGAQPKPGIYRGDFSLGVQNSTGKLNPKATIDWSHYNGGYSLAQWQTNTGQDAHSQQVVANANGVYASEHILAIAKAKLFAV